MDRPCYSLHKYQIFRVIFDSLPLSALLQKTHSAVLIFSSICVTFWYLVPNKLVDVKEHEWPFARLPNVAILSENLPAGLCGAKRCQSQWHGIDGFRPMCHTSSISTLPPRILKYTKTYTTNLKLTEGIQLVKIDKLLCVLPILKLNTNTRKLNKNLSYSKSVEGGRKSKITLNI